MLGSSAGFAGRSRSSRAARAASGARWRGASRPRACASSSATSRSRRARRRGRRARATGADVEGVVTDVTDPEQMQALADAAVAAVRRRARRSATTRASAAAGCRGRCRCRRGSGCIGVNLWGVIHGVRTFVPLLMQQPEAHIVNTASVAGLVAAPFMGPYNASKHGVVAISETLHHELAMIGAAREGLGAVPGLGQHQDRRERAEPARRTCTTATATEAGGADAAQGLPRERAWRPTTVAGQGARRDPGRAVLDPDARRRGRLLGRRREPAPAVARRRDRTRSSGCPV